MCTQSAPAPGAGAPELCFISAVDVVEAIRGRRLSVREVVSEHLRQIERVNPKVNAICTLEAERALQQADRADETLSRGDGRRWLSERQGDDRAGGTSRGRFPPGTGSART